jgi:hypothetical protein
MQSQPGAAEELSVSHRGSELEIVRRWFNRRTVVMTVFVVIAIGILVFALSRIGALGPGSLQLFDPDSDIDLFERLMKIGFISIAIFFTYRIAADWLNRTWIVVDRETLTVRHGPVPWPGVGPIRVADIKQFHTRASASYSGKGQYQRTTYTYEVHSELNDGRSLKLIGGFASAESATRVKEEIDRHLGLKPVQEQAGPGTTPGPETGETTIQGVVGVWLFILIWNGVIWWTALTLWGNSRLKNAEVAFAFFALFALIGFGLICLAIPATWKFFRQNAARRPDSASVKSGWGAVICLLAIAAGFILILMQAPWR